MKAEKDEKVRAMKLNVYVMDYHTIVHDYAGHEISRTSPQKVRVAAASAEHAVMSLPHPSNSLAENRVTGSRVESTVDYFCPDDLEEHHEEYLDRLKDAKAEAKAKKQGKSVEDENGPAPAGTKVN